MAIIPHDAGNRDQGTQRRLADGAACLDAALEYLALGWSALIVCPPDHVGVGQAHGRNCASHGKAPWGAWKDFQSRLPSEADLRNKWKTLPNGNVGMAYGSVSGLVGVDIDGPAGEALLQHLCGGDLPDTLEFRTGSGQGRRLLFAIPSGAQLRTTAEQAAPGQELRFQAQGAQTVMPPSRHASGGLYAWVPGHGPGEIEPAVAPAWLLSQFQKERPQQAAAERNGAAGKRFVGHAPRAVDRARSYIAKIPPAISGEGGQNRTFHVACCLVLGFDLAPDAALPLLREYNARCKPPWTEEELGHKLEDANKKTEPRGYLLRENAVTEQQVLDDELIDELLHKDVTAALVRALEAEPLSALARLLDRAPGRWEGFLQNLRKAGATVRDTDVLQRSVNREAKRLRKLATPSGKGPKSALGRLLSASPEADRKTFFANHYEATTDGMTSRHGHSVQHLAQWLSEISGGWPKRIGTLLFARQGDEPVWLESANALMAWIGSQLPGGQDASRLIWERGADLVTQERFFAYLCQAAESYENLERMPHWSAMSGTYYLHPRPQGDGCSLTQLVHRFSPATDVDRDLILAFFLSLAWGGRPGQRPAWLLTADDDDGPEKGRGVGKTKLAEMAALLMGGAITLCANESQSDLMVRLLSPDAICRRVALLDNIKTLKFSWAQLESLVTCQTLSGRRLYSGEGRRPNVLTWVLTLNGATLSKDMAQRCVIVKLKRPKRDPNWEESTAAFIEVNRWAIIGDIIAELQRPVAQLTRHSRWGAWEDAVLARVDEPGEAQRVIEERQNAVDDDAGEADLVREVLFEELVDRGHDPASDRVFISSREMAVIVNAATNDRRPTNKANSYLNTLHIEELRQSRRGAARGWVWSGKKADSKTETQCLKSRSAFYGTAT